MPPGRKVASALKRIQPRTNAHAAPAATPVACTGNWSMRLPLATARASGRAMKATISVPQTPQMPCTGMAPTASSMRRTRSIR